MWECTISIVNDIGTQVANTGIGVVACLLGDVSGGSQLIATELIDIAAVGAELRGQSVKRIRQSTQAKVLKTLNDDPAFASVSHERIRGLLSRQSVSFTRSELIEASTAAIGLDLDAALAQRVYDAIPFDGDDEATKRFVYLALEAGMRACNAEDGFRDEVRKTQLIHLVQAVSGFNQKLDTLIKQSGDKARELHLTEQLFISLARRIANDVADIDQAHRELERVVGVASDEQAKSALPANTDEAITAILARVDELNNTGLIDEAATHLVEEEARAEAGLTQLYDKGIAQAVLTRDVDMACDYEAKKIAIDAAEPAAQFDALRRVYFVWWTRGRDNGLNFDLEVAIELAHKNCRLASDVDQRGAAQNNLGVALSTLGDRESDTQRLEEAVVAYRAALEERTRDRVPLDWASTQNNLGGALKKLGERESDIQRLKEAMMVYRAALEEYTQDRAPLDWARTQNNLGAVLSILGDRESDTKLLEEAVVAYRAALEERTRDRVPLDWASTQSNLGGAFQVLGQLDSDTQRLEEAVVAYRAALEECTRDRVPLDWAMTQQDLAITMLAFANHPATTDRRSTVEAALEYVNAALEVFELDQSSFNHEKIMRLRQHILQRLAIDD